MTNASQPKRLSPTDWATIVTIYQRGEKNLRELAEQFDVSLQAISQGLKSRGVQKGSRLGEVIGEIDDAARKERERKVASANTAVEQYAKYNDALVKMTMKKVVEGSQTPGGIGLINAEILTIKNAIAIVRTARQENWEIMKVDELLGKNAVLPDLNVGEYTPEELDKIRKANEEGYLQGLDDEGETAGIDDIADAGAYENRYEDELL